MNRRLHWIVLVLLLAAAPAEAARHALVIGNADYQASPLKNPVNDAEDMAAKLGGLGFEVVKLINASRDELREGLERFVGRVGAGDEAFLYYSGHGVQIRGENYLIPVGEDIDEASDVEWNAVPMARLLRRLKDSGTRVNVVVLDACRDNPFYSGSRSASRGLSRMAGPVGSLIAFATAPGQTASDGRGRNGVYTEHLLEHIDTPGLPVEQIFKRVRADVLEATGGSQRPWENSSLTADVYLAGRGSIERSRPAPEAAPDARTGTVVVQSEPAGAKVHINGGYAGAAPQRLPGLPGGENVTIRVTRAGHEPHEQKVFVKPGERTELKVLLESEAPDQAALTVATEPADARVRVMNIEPVYHDGMELDPGAYDLYVTAEGYKPYRQWHELSAGEQQIEVQLDSQDGTRRSVTTNQLKVRTGPGTRFPAVARLERGDMVSILSRKRDWARIGAGRWVHTAYLGGKALGDGASSEGAVWMTPSFNCEKASTEVEHAICDIDQLADADARLGKLYRALREALSDDEFSKLQDSQRKWLNERDRRILGKCKRAGRVEAECAVNVYNKRIKELSVRP